MRLSEALAKLHGSDEVLVRHVTEAAYLLKTSIVRIEQEAVNLEDTENAEDEAFANGETEQQDSVDAEMV